VYLALVRAGFKRQRLYIGSVVAGFAANLFFGLFRSAIFMDLSRHRIAAGLDEADTLTYVWMVQVLFGVVFSPWFWEWPDSVRSGDFLAELLRPGDVFARLAAVDFGRSMFILLVRGLPLLFLPALFVRLALPRDPAGWAALAVCLVMACVAGFQFRFVFGCLAFWTADYRAWWGFSFGLVWIAAGLVVPVQFFPQPFRWLAADGPFAVLMVIPYRVAIGQQVLASVGLELLWVGLGLFACRAMMAKAARDVVVHGG
jgi:ABC-2 type transport system permease protein